MRIKIKTVTLEEYETLLKSQGHFNAEDVTFMCPRCGTIQSARDLMDAGVGETLDEVDKYLAFSCVGRWNDKKGCNWTLGGLFQIHNFAVVTPDGVQHPRFEPMTIEEAKEREKTEKTKTKKGE